MSLFIIIRVNIKTLELGGLNVEDDMDLVRKILKGDTDSFEILMKRYENIVYRYCCGVLKNSAAAEDATQEVFIQVYNKLYTFRQLSKLQSWIMRIAHNKCIDYIRKNKISEVPIDDVLNLHSNEGSPEDAAEGSEQIRTFQNFMSKLNDIDRQIIILKYTNRELTFYDIGEILNISEGAAKKRFYRAREKYKAISLNCVKECEV